MGTKRFPRPFSEFQRICILTLSFSNNLLRMKKVNAMILLRWHLFSVPWCGPKEKARPQSYVDVA